MRIDVFFHSETDERFSQILDRLDRIEQKETLIMASLDDTLAAVTAETTADNSIIALLNGIAAQLATALGGALSPANQAKVDAIFAAATANASAVNAAIAANTPAAPTP